MVNIQGVEIHIRTNTPDINVAINSLYKKEYDNIKLKYPSFIIDAGANIGTSSIFFAKKYPNAQIIAIEPEDGNFKLLKQNTNAYKNVVAIKAAIWGSEGKKTVKNLFAGHWGYTIADTQKKQESTGQKVDCITIKSLLDKYDINTIDIIKMDIEGGEEDVLSNSSGWIDSTSVITVELHDRICMGCSRAFYLATKKFKNFEKHGDKVTAYRY